MTVPMLMPNAAAGNLSLHFGARAYARTVASACASSTESIVNAVEHLRDGLADVVIAGGTESVIHPSRSRRSRRCRRSPSATTPRDASRPGSIDRDGFVMGEGAGVLILETEEHAKARGAKIYAVVVGGGVTADSYHITANDPRAPARRAPSAALDMAGASPTTSPTSTRTPSTPVGDPNEYVALKSVFGDRIDEIPVSATKASTGSPPRRHRRARGDLHGPGPPRPRRSADDQHHRAGPGGAVPPVRRAARRSATATSSRSATRSASAATTPSRVRLGDPSTRSRPPSKRRISGAASVGRGCAISVSGKSEAGTRASTRPSGERDVGLSAHLVQPHDGCVVARVPERLELLVPRGTERDLQFALQLEDVAAAISIA
jgi:hypothetical protein